MSNKVNEIRRNLRNGIGSRFITVSSRYFSCDFAIFTPIVRSTSTAARCSGVLGGQ